MKKNALLLMLSLAPAAFAADLTGRFEAGTKCEEPAAHAPANVSRMFAKAVPRAARTNAVELPATGGSGMIIWTNASAPVKTRLRTPHGAILQPNDRGSVERGLRRFELDAHDAAELGRGAHEVVHVMETAAATYQLEVEMPEGVIGAMVLAAEPESPLTLSTWAAPLSRQPGQPVTLHAELRDGASPLTGATVVARLASPNGKSFDAVTLTDRGDGVYTAMLAELPDTAAGAWQVRFEAEGTNASGARFARTGSGELVAERGAARLGRLQMEVVDDSLRISLPADVRISGSYRFDVIAADNSGNSIAWAEGQRQLETGATTLTIDIPLTTLGNTNVKDLFLDVRLLGLDTMGVAGRVTSK